MNNKFALAGVVLVSISFLGLLVWYFYLRGPGETVCDSKGTEIGSLVIKDNIEKMKKFGINDSDEILSSILIFTSLFTRLKDEDFNSVLSTLEADKEKVEKSKDSLKVFNESFKTMVWSKKSGMDILNSSKTEDKNLIAYFDSFKNRVAVDVSPYKKIIGDTLEDFKKSYKEVHDKVVSLTVKINDDDVKVHDVVFFNLLETYKSIMSSN